MSRPAGLGRGRRDPAAGVGRGACAPAVFAEAVRGLAGGVCRRARAAKTRGGTRRFAAGVALAAALALAPSPQAYAQKDPSPEPREIVEQTTEAVLEVLRDSELSAEEQRRRIRDIAYARFDFETISRLVLGRYRDRFSEPQRDAFVSEFKRFLALRYWERVGEYSGERIRVTASIDRPQGDVLVRSYVLGGSVGRAEVDYRLRRMDGEWRIIDVVAGGRSLIVSYREQIRELFQQGGPEAVLARLRERNAELDRDGPEESTGRAAPSRGRATIARMAIRSRGLQASP